MARPFSLDLRLRVMSQLQSGLSCREVAELNDIAPSTVVKWSMRQRQTGKPAPKRMGGYRTCLLASEGDWLRARVAEKPDLTLHALLAELAERGVTVSCDTLWRFLKRQQLSFKKNSAAARAASP